MDSTQNTFGSFQNSRFSDGLIREGISFFEEYSSFSFCQIDSVRDANEHPTSRQIDSIRKASDFSSEERLEKASSVYEAWRKKNSGSTATVVLDCGKDCEYPTVRLGRLYIAKYLRGLGIIDRLRRLRAEKDRLSMLMAKQFLRIDTLEKYSGLKIEKKE